MLKAKRVVACALAVALVGSTPMQSMVNSQAKAKKAVVSVSISNVKTKVLVLKKGKKFTLKTKVKVKGGASKKVSFKSNTPKVVSVSKKGVLKAKKAGTAKITVKSKANSKKKKVLTVKVGTPVTKVTVNPSKMTLTVGKSAQINPTVSPKKATLKSVSYKSNNTKVATVNSKGLVVAKSNGTAKIVVTAKDGSKKNASVLVTVNKGAATTTAKKPAATTEAPAPSYACSKKYTEKDVVFKDDFNGTKLDESKWNYETHEPGWVNNELQSYVKSDKNVYVKDGKLVIQALKDKDGNYTSGRVNTQNKVDYKYGRFEARLKVPEGQGFLPAFWMMPTDESLYGQWPKCGEIDIMEVLGNDTKTAYSTLHFGEPHKELQGKYTLSKGDFYSQYHTYTCEWEPDAISFYVDGVFVHKETNWFSKKDGFDEVAYPAPYDQSFYMILNLAVGGNWPGNPDKTTTFDKKAQMSVDYVKVYHKDDASYEEAEANAKKPVTEEASYKEADESGNFVTNGDFGKESTFDDDNEWKFLTAGTGEGAGVATASIKDGQLDIATEKAGNLDYSVQMIQSYMPIKKGTKYKYSFDAYADEARTMKTDISAPENGWIRYLPDQKVELTKEKQHYEFEFESAKYNDPYGRVEFNLGNQPSTATVHIDNVRLEEVGTFEVSNQLPDGNFVYNGGFDQGANDAGIKRMQYWDVTNNGDAKVSVTNSKNVRQLKVETPESSKALGDVIVSQKNITIKPGVKYFLAFEAKADKAKKIKTTIAGQEFEADLTTEMKKYKFSFVSDKAAFEDADKVLQFLLGTEGTVYLDNVRVQTDALITNGDFEDGMTGFEVFADSSVKDGVTHIIENQQEDTKNACEVTIKDTGDADWKVQLKQTNVTLEKGQWYTFSFDAKCNMDRAIKYAFQRDGATHKTEAGGEDWTQYSGEDTTVDLTNEFKTYTTTFQMTEDTDPETILSFSLGAVNDKQIAKEHKIAIDNIALTKTTDPAANLLSNDKIETSCYADDGAATDINFDKTTGIGTFDISNVGTDEWHVQLKQAGLSLEEGATYKLTLKANSTSTRPIKVGVMDPSNSYHYYGGTTANLAANELQTIEVTIDAVDVASDTVEFSVSMGAIKDQVCPAGKITLSDFSLVKVAK